MLAHTWFCVIDPGQSLEITALLQVAASAAWLLLVPAFALDHGEGAPQAVASLEAWCSWG